MRKLRFLLCLLLLLHAPCPGLAVGDTAPWHEPRASVRFVVAADMDLWNNGDHCGAVLVSFCPAGMNPEKTVPHVYDQSGARIGCRILYARMGEPMTVLLAEPAIAANAGVVCPTNDDLTCFLYLVSASESTPPPSWEPCAGLVLDARTCLTNTNLHELSAQNFEALWKQASYTNGAAVVAAIHYALPVLPVVEDVPLEYATYVTKGLMLNRCTGYFRFTRDREALRGVEETLAEAKTEETKLLELIERAHFKLREAEYELGISAVYTNVIKVSPEVLRERLYSRLAEYDRLDKTQRRKLDAVMQTASNAVEGIRTGLHTFFMGSRAGSHLFVDGKELLTWPAEKALNRSHGRFINLDSASVPLEEGLHRLDYLHYAQGDDCMATVAWRTPGQGEARTMSSSDFVQVADGRIRSVEFRDASKPPLMFSWRIVEDLRCPSAGDMVQMDLWVTEPRPDCRYEWTLGDGLKAGGTEVSHLYFQTGSYLVQLSEYGSAGSSVTRTVTQNIMAHVLWTKQHLTELPQYGRMIVGMDLAQARLPGLLNAYDFARKAATETQPLNDWREHLIRALIPRLAEFPSNQVPQVLQIAQDACSPRIRRYEEAGLAYSNVLRRLPANDPARVGAALAYSELLLTCYGDANSALQWLNQFKADKTLTVQHRLRLQLLTAGALLAQGKGDGAVALLNSLVSLDPESATKLAIRQLAELRYVQNLVAKEPPDFDELSTAVEKVESLIQEDPRQALSAETNLVLLHAFLGRGECAKALHLADRMLNLALTDVLRPAVLAARVRAMYGTGDLAGARTAFQELLQKYPYSEETKHNMPAELKP